MKSIKRTCGLRRKFFFRLPVNILLDFILLVSFCVKFVLMVISLATFIFAQLSLPPKPNFRKLLKLRSQMVLMLNIKIQRKKPESKNQPAEETRKQN